MLQRVWVSFCKADLSARCMKFSTVIHQISGIEDYFLRVNKIIGMISYLSHWTANVFFCISKAGAKVFLNEHMK